MTGAPEKITGETGGAGDGEKTNGERREKNPWNGRAESQGKERQRNGAKTSGNGRSRWGRPGAG